MRNKSKSEDLYGMWEQGDFDDMLSAKIGRHLAEFADRDVVKLLKVAAHSMAHAGQVELAALFLAAASDPARYAGCLKTIMDSSGPSGDLE